MISNCLKEQIQTREGLPKKQTKNKRVGIEEDGANTVIK